MFLLEGLEKVTSSRGGGFEKITVDDKEVRAEGYKKSKVRVTSFVNGP